MPRRLAGLILVLLLAAGCAEPLPVPTAPPVAVPEPGAGDIDAGAWAAAMCQSVDQLQQAVGDPTTGQRSTAWQDFEAQLTGADEERLKAAANGVLGHLTEGSRQASTATSFEPGAAAASRMEQLQDSLADGVRSLRDGALAGSPEQVTAGRTAIDATIEEHYEQAFGQMSQVPLGGVALPCLPG